MAYVDGFLLPVPRRKLPLYRRIARRAGHLWLKHGAVEYRETAGDDLKTRFGTPFTKVARTRSGEVPVLSWIVYQSKRHRDQVNRKVMSDPAMKKLMTEPMPFDVKRMAYGGFKVIVDM